MLIFCGPLAAQTALLATATTLEKVNIFIIIRSIAVKILSLLDKADDNGQCRDSRALDKAVQLTAQKIHYCWIHLQKMSAFDDENPFAVSDFDIYTFFSIFLKRCAGHLSTKYIMICTSPPEQKSSLFGFNATFPFHRTPRSRELLGMVLEVLVPRPHQTWTTTTHLTGRRTPLWPPRPPRRSTQAVHLRHKGHPQPTHLRGNNSKYLRLIFRCALFLCFHQKSREVSCLHKLALTIVSHSIFCSLDRNYRYIHELSFMTFANLLLL